jgi:hypothetical protein
MFVTFSAKIAIRAEFYPSILFIKTNWIALHMTDVNKKGLYSINL